MRVRSLQMNDAHIYCTREQFENVVVDTTVQEKAIAYPVDSRLLEIGRHKVVHAAKRG